MDDGYMGVDYSISENYFVQITLIKAILSELQCFKAKKSINN